MEPDFTHTSFQESARPLVVAHRSLTPGATGNVRSAIPLAALAGAHLIELDIRLSLDRIPVLLHDAMLSRSTHAHGWVGLWPAALLKRLRVRGGSDLDTIPTLASILANFPDTAAPALHLKDRRALDPVIADLTHSGFGQRAWLWLEHHDDVRHAMNRAPGIRCVLLRPDGWHDATRHLYLTDASRSGAAGVSFPWRLIDERIVVEAHRHQLLAFSRLESLEHLRANINAGLDGIVTADPAAAIAVIDARLARKRPPGSL